MAIYNSKKMTSREKKMLDGIIERVNQNPTRIKEEKKRKVRAINENVKRLRERIKKEGKRTTKNLKIKSSKKGY